MQVIYELAARKGLKRMPLRDQDAMERKLRIYAETGVGDVIKLVNRDKWRLRHGDWRAVFLLINDVIVIEIAHRRDIYR